MASRRRATVLVLTDQFDPTADIVIEKLNAADVPVFRCDSAEFPGELQLYGELDCGWTGRLASRDREVRLETIRSVYFRGPSQFEFPASMSKSERQFAAAEARMGFGGVLSSLPCLWVNHPARIADAEYKPLQLRFAQECGLQVPRTIITNDPAQARRFAASLGTPIVYKPLAAVSVSEEGVIGTIYMTVVSPEDLEDDRISLTAHLFQAWVPKAHDVRLTVVSDAFFPVAIHALSDAAQVDWRSDYDQLRYEITEIPSGVRVGVAGMLGRLGLNFGALDFVVTPEGQWVFLELNPNGQWAWIEAATGVPVSETIAEVLQNGMIKSG